MKYAEQLKDPRWQKKRLEVLQRDDFTCRECRNQEKQLHVHHSFYEKGLMIWEYPLDAYHSLCAKCHILRQTAESHLLRGVQWMSSDDLERLAILMVRIELNNLNCVDVVELFEEAMRSFKKSMDSEMARANPDGIMEMKP